MGISDLKRTYKVNLSNRLIDFAVNTIKFLSTIPYKKEHDVFRYQLSKAATSIGANYEKSQACTKREFHAKISICLREVRETNFWYKVIDKLNLGEGQRRKNLLRESHELKLILGSIESKESKTRTNKIKE